VKWPNDIISADAKLAGVLVSRHQAKGLVWLIAGIGVNLLWKEPPQLERPVTDLKTLGVMDPDPSMLVAEIFSELQRLWRGEILTHGWEQEFMKRDTLSGCTVDVVHPLTGKVLQRGENNGVSAAGDLLLQVGRETVPVKIGELSLRRILQ
jgi:biotin-[acetyl-CoA-carboxylase] ligase/type 3 pantothenate kinase